MRTGQAGAQYSMRTNKTGTNYSMHTTQAGATYWCYMRASGGHQGLHAGEPDAQHGLPRYASSQRSLRSRHSLRS